MQSAYASTLILVFVPNFAILISSSHPIVLTRLGGLRSRSYKSRNVSRVQLEIKPGTFAMVVRYANHYTKRAVTQYVQCSKIQGGREISDIILTADYLCYKEPKNPLNFFLILIFNELF